jgi:RNA polymerase sigma factor (sigma-70 family)
MPELFRYLNRLCGDHAMASDIAQETFVRLYERGEMPRNVRAWLATVANNQFRDDRRRAGRRRVLLASRTPEHTLGDAPIAPDAALMQDECRDTVRAALECLPDRDRQLLLLRHEGYSYSELANALGIVASSVGSRLARASKAFSRALEGRPVDED